MSVYLFDMAGDPIAFKRSWSDPHVFALDGQWIGWCPWDDNQVVGADGAYLGSVVDDRLVRRNDWTERSCATPCEHPSVAVATGTPSRPHPFPNRFAYTDVADLLLR